MQGWSWEEKATSACLWWSCGFNMNIPIVWLTLCGFSRIQPAFLGLFLFMDIKRRRASQKVGSQNSGRWWFYLFVDSRKTHNRCHWWLYCKIWYWKNNFNQQSDSSLAPTDFQCSWPAMPGWELCTEGAGWQMGSVEQGGSWQQAKEFLQQVVRVDGSKRSLTLSFAVNKLLSDILSLGQQWRDLQQLMGSC